MTIDVTVRRDTHTIWGRTGILVEFKKSRSSFCCDVTDHADVYSNEFAVIAISRGACMNTVRYVFDPSPIVVNRISQSKILGLTLVDQNSVRKAFRASGHDTFTMIAGPTDLVIQADAEGTLREVHRAPLAETLSVIAETLLPIGPATLKCDPQSTRILLPAA